MFNNLAKSTDTVSCGLVASTSPVEQMTALGRFTIQCYDKDGNLKWEDSNHNLVVATGLQYMAGVALNQTANLVTQISSWYIGLYGAGASNSPAYNDTMASHAGWTEATGYSNATRPQCLFVAATLPTSGGAPSVATNTGSAASFSINASNTIGGAFLTSSSTKGGTTGTLFSAADFQAPGDRIVASGDTLNVTYTFNLTPA